MVTERELLKQKRFEINVEMNKLNHLRCEKCRTGSKVKSSELNCCEAAIRTLELDQELLRLKGREIKPLEEEITTVTNRKMYKDHTKYTRIAKANGINRSTYMSRIQSGVPEDVAATYTREGLREWKKRHDKQNSASGKAN